MKYNEWRDELKNNLLSVTDAERRRVLDYYAEAYADRREAGFTEREIIDDFGAPYDAAQRILCENSDDCYQEQPNRKARNDNREQKNHTSYSESFDDHDTFYSHESKTHSATQSNNKTKSSGSGGIWLFIILCIIFSVPIFIVVMTLVGVTIGLCSAPFVASISGVVTIFGGIGTMFANPLSGVLTLAEGIITLGIGIILIPLCFKLVKWIWKLLTMFFGWIKKLCSEVKA